MAAFNNVGSYLSNGSTFAGIDGNSKESTRCTTKYTSDSQTLTYEKYYPGDATYEVYKGSDKAWNSDNSYFVYSNAPFFIRGGGYSTDVSGRYIFRGHEQWQFGQHRFIPCSLARRVALIRKTDI